MPSAKLPPIEEWQHLLDSGLSHQSIADTLTRMVGQQVTRIAVTQAVRRAGLPRRKPMYDEWLPWVVATKHTKSYPATMLRAFARLEAAGGNWDALPASLAARLRNWLQLLEESDEVVDYKALTGFTYVPRRPGERLRRVPPKAKVDTRPDSIR